VPAYIKKAVQILKPDTDLDLQEDGNKCHRSEGKTLSNDWRRPKEFEAAKNCRGTDWNCAMKAAGWMKRARFQDVQVKSEESSCWYARQEHIETMIFAVVNNALSRLGLKGLFPPSDV